MKTFKTIIAATFLGGFICGFIGLIGGLIIPGCIWPKSNLAPMMGAIYALPIGTVVGAIIGLGVAIIRVLRARRRRPT